MKNISSEDVEIDKYINEKTGLSEISVTMKDGSGSLIISPEKPTPQPEPITGPEANSETDNEYALVVVVDANKNNNDNISIDDGRSKASSYLQFSDKDISF
jgi:hypothetical protein